MSHRLSVPHDPPATGATIRRVAIRAARRAERYLVAPFLAAVDRRRTRVRLAAREPSRADRKRDPR